MRAGRLDRRITIQQAVETQSDSGEVIQTWGDVATVWAEMLPLPGSERFALQQTVGRSLLTYRVRYTSITAQVTVKHRLMVKGRVLDISDVRELKRNEEIQIDCYADSDQPIDSSGALDALEVEDGGELLLE